jgi:hypothetical protein
LAVRDYEILIHRRTVRIAVNSGIVLIGKRVRIPEAWVEVASIKQDFGVSTDAKTEKRYQ